MTTATRSFKNLSKAILIAFFRRRSAGMWFTAHEISEQTGLSFNYTRQRCRQFASFSPPILEEGVTPAAKGRPTYRYRLAPGCDYHERRIRFATRQAARQHMDDQDHQWYMRIAAQHPVVVPPRPTSTSTPARTSSPPPVKKPIPEDVVNAFNRWKHLLTLEPRTPEIDTEMDNLEARASMYGYRFPPRTST